MKLVKHWRTAWRWHSTQIMALAAGLQVLWAELPPEAIVVLPPEWQKWITAALLVSGMLLRLRDQSAEIE